MRIIPARRRGVGIALVVLAPVLAALALLAAFTVYGSVAAVLAVVCAGSGARLLARAPARATAPGRMVRRPPRG